MKKAIFLDRDGVIIENVSTYVRSWSDVHFLPGALTALARLAELPLSIVLVTNQSVVGRGLISFDAAVEINRLLVDQICAAGGRIDGVFLCPHAPQAGCACRKPQPGLLLQAAKALSLDLPSSIMIGDALSDLEAGRAAGIARNILVLTGRGAQQVLLPEAQRLAPLVRFADLLSVVDALTAGLLS